MSLKSSYYKYKDILDALFLTIIVLLVLWSATLALYGGRGAEVFDNVIKVIFYFSFGVVGYLVIFMGKISQFIIKITGSKLIKEKIGWFGSIIHDPEEGLIGRYTKANWIHNRTKFIIAGILIFGLWGVFASLTTQTLFLTELPVYQQQVLPLAGTFLSVEPASLMEELGWVALLGLYWYIIKYFSEKKKWSQSQYWAFVISGILLIGTFSWLGFHLFRYSASEKALISVVFFGFMKSMILLLTASIFWIWIFHSSNNLFQALLESYPKDSVIIWTFVFFVTAGSLFLFYLIRTRNKKSFVDKPDLP